MQHHPSVLPGLLSVGGGFLSLQEALKPQRERHHARAAGEDPLLSSYFSAHWGWSRNLGASSHGTIHGRSLDCCPGKKTSARSSSSLRAAARQIKSDLGR